MDGGHQAITFDDDRQPRIVGAECVGCHLCRPVCPTGAIGIEGTNLNKLHESEFIRCPEQEISARVGITVVVYVVAVDDVVEFKEHTQPLVVLICTS